MGDMHFYYDFESLELIGIQLPEEFKENFDVSSEGPLRS